MTSVPSSSSARRPPRGAGAARPGAVGQLGAPAEEDAAGGHAGAHRDGGVTPLAVRADSRTSSPSSTPEPRGRPRPTARRAGRSRGSAATGECSISGPAQSVRRARPARRPSGARRRRRRSGAVGRLRRRRARTAASRSCQRTPRPPISSSVMPA